MKLLNRVKEIVSRVIKCDKKSIISKFFKTLSGITKGGIAYLLSRVMQSRTVWLIGETDITAQDNGYHLFKYIREKDPKKRCYYLIDKKSPDKEKVEKLGNVVYHGSFRHLLYLFQAEKHIGSHDYRYWHYPGFSKVFSRVFDRFIEGKFIQIQHGIIHIKSERGFHYDQKKPYDMICVSSQYEKDLLKEHFGHSENVLEITGLCRYDELVNQNLDEKSIVFMPTWRKDIQKADDFLGSEYCNRIEGLLMDKRLIDSLREKKVKFYLYLHIKLQHHSLYFKKYENDVVKVILLGEESVQNLIKKENLMLTDYSSVSLDFAYLNKPVIFYQWDFEDYVKSYDVENPEEYQKMRFGYICGSKNEVVEKIAEYLSNDFKVNSIHKEKSNLYFEYRDKKNCERVYKAIEEL